jgi:hypothetical protein
MRGCELKTNEREQPPAFTFQSMVIPQGEGGYLIKPGKPVLGRRRLTVREAAAQARVSTDTIMRLYDAGFLEGERPSPRKTFIFEDSLSAHLKSTVDKEFWDAQGRRNLYLASIRGEKLATVDPEEPGLRSPARSQGRPSAGAIKGQGDTTPRHPARSRPGCC